jgi:hypothetical protein
MQSGHGHMTPNLVHDARSNRSSRTMVRQAYHDRLGLPLVPSSSSGLALRLVEGCAPFKTFKLKRSPFQSFNRFALFKTSQANAGSKRSRVPVVPIVDRIQEDTGAPRFREFRVDRNKR